MKTLITVLCAALLLGLATSVQAATKVHHVVAFKFKATATPDDIKKVEKAFSGLKKKIPTIVKFQWGKNISPEKLNKGFTHCWALTFNDVKDRDAYLVHPDHKAFGTLINPFIEDVFVFDYVSEK